MGIARSTYYYKPRGKRPSDMDLAERIEKIALDFPSYGYRRITAELHRQKIKANHKRVLRLMRDKNLLCRARKAFKATTDSSHGLIKYPNLIDDLIPLLWFALIFPPMAIGGLQQNFIVRKSRQTTRGC
ncbi:hypothetical protein ES705_45583 [subsurface metagenome]